MIIRNQNSSSKMGAKDANTFYTRMALLENTRKVINDKQKQIKMLEEEIELQKLIEKNTLLNGSII